MKHPLWFAALVAGLVSPAFAQRAADAAPAAAPTEARIARLLEEMGVDAQVFDQHVTTLSNPWFEGRVPGSRGMELAREYFEYYLRQAGTQAPFPGDGDARSYRQVFPLSGRRKPTVAEFAIGDQALRAGEDFNVLGVGDSGEVTGPVVFVGYGINQGPDDYTSFPRNEDLTDKIALVFRFEPMTAEGKSQWATRGPWTRQESLAGKVRNLARRHAAGVIIINPPGVDDPRANQLYPPGGGGRRRGKIEIPAIHLSTGAAQRLLESLNASATEPRTWMDLRKACDAGGTVVDFGGSVTIKAELKADRIRAENVGGMIPGKGALKDEWIVIGGHLDHLGIGLYGARDRNRIGTLHPGADDNASGSAAVLMLADKLMRDYQKMPADAAARSLLFIGFDAEEAGLHGARFYVNEPIAPIEEHALMINFDMIGRITDKKLSVSGTASAKGMSEWLSPLFAETPLDILDTKGMAPVGSDHMMFVSKKVPSLFAIIGKFHDDYHTPDDVAWKINREDAVHTIHLFHKIALTAATRPERFEFDSAAGARNRRRGR